MTLDKVCFVFDFILHTEYTVDACALTRLLPSLSIIDMTYCAAYPHSPNTPPCVLLS
jgi:hypothetical protein